MSDTKKLQQLLEQKNKLEEQIKEATQKRLNDVATILEKHGLHRWANNALNNLFKHAANQGENEYKKAPSKKPVEQNTQQSIDNQQVDYQQNG